MFQRRKRRREKFLKFDIYGNEVRYTYKKDYTYKTKRGGILSILLVISLVVMVWIYFNQ